MFNFNDGFYEWILLPMVKGYNWFMPESVRIAISKAIHNLMFPLRFVNNLLQFKVQDAATELGRFVINSTVGLVGLFDPAGRYFHWLPHEEDFGQTLAFYGVGPGAPFVIPLLGQSSIRDGVGILPNYLLHPVYQTAGYEPYLGTEVLRNFNYVSLQHPEYDSIKRDALDPYAFVRDAYKQNREKLNRE